jgi:hypothetical protein
MPPVTTLRRLSCCPAFSIFFHFFAHLPAISHFAVAIFDMLLLLIRPSAGFSACLAKFRHFRCRFHIDFIIIHFRYFFAARLPA